MPVNIQKIRRRLLLINKGARWRKAPGHEGSLPRSAYTAGLDWLACGMAGTMDMF